MTMQQPGRGIPNLGAQKPPEIMRVVPNLTVIPVHADADGIVAEIPVGGILDRALYMDAEQLLAAIQGIVRHELKGLAVRLGRQDVADAMEK